LHTYLSALTDPNAIAAIKLTVTVAAIAVPLNVLFGVAASWAIAKFDFRGKSALISLIDLPFAVSPVISGLIYVLMFGARHRAGHHLRHLSVRGARVDPGDADARA
jgi:sulfate transport system permease protein